MNNENKFEEFWKVKDYQKTWSIAFFSSTNAAIEVMKTKTSTDDTELKAGIVFWRDWLLEEHGKFYFDKIATANLDTISPNVVAGLDKAKALYEDKK